ncbi:hypothetical protein [Dryocola clanedunensis]
MKKVILAVAFWALTGCSTHKSIPMDSPEMVEFQSQYMGAITKVFPSIYKENHNLGACAFEIKIDRVGATTDVTPLGATAICIDIAIAVQVAKLANILPVAPKRLSPGRATFSVAFSNTHV